MKNEFINKIMYGAIIMIAITLIIISIVIHNHKKTNNNLVSERENSNVIEEQSDNTNYIKNEKDDSNQGIQEETAIISQENVVSSNTKKSINTKTEEQNDSNIQIQKDENIEENQNNENENKEYIEENKIEENKNDEQNIENNETIQDNNGSINENNEEDNEEIQNNNGNKGILARPVDEGVITAVMYLGSGEYHGALDYGVPIGTTVYAAADGVVLSAGWRSGGYGYAVIIQHDNELRTYYAQGNGVFYVSEGDRVIKGQPIMLSGNSGNSTGPHLHFEVRVSPYTWVYGGGEGDCRVDPRDYF